MQTIIRKIGNANGVIIPARLLQKFSLKTGDKVNIDEVNGQIVIKPAKPKYTLDELLAKCDPTAPMSSEMKLWDHVRAINNEIF